MKNGSLFEQKDAKVAKELDPVQWIREAESILRREKCRIDITRRRYDRGKRVVIEDLLQRAEVIIHLTPSLPSRPSVRSSSPETAQ